MIKDLLREFMQLVANEQVEVYNEFSFQHELGIFLRNRLTEYKVEFERNTKFFGIDGFKKHEIDIVVYNKTSNRFMSRFEIINEYADKSFNNLWRIFDTMERYPDKLPEKTFIQKAYKTHLKNGGKMESGEGLFFC